MYSDRRLVTRDFQFLCWVIAALVVIGLVFVYSSSSVYALAYAHDAAYFLKKQVFGLALGLIAAAILSRVSLHTWYRLAPWLFFGALFLTLLTLVPGVAFRVHGSARWIRIAGLVFQPSEVLKWALVIFIAYVLARKETLIKTVWRRYIPILFVVGIVCVALLKQPDFGLSVTLAATVICLLFIAYPDWKYVACLLLAALPIAGLLIYLEPYRLKRVLTFLNPWQDPQGAGFQVIQSLIAIGSGGIFGVGISQSRQKFFYLPMQHTDFIFSIIAEETGFVGSCIVVLLFLLFLYKGLQLSWRFTQPFARYIVQGFTLLVSVQAMINIAVAVGLFPTKGIGLPFVSYGNSSLLCSLAMVGVIASCVRSEQL